MCIRDRSAPKTALPRRPRALHSAGEPAQSSWARMADSMVLIKLRKASEGEEWGALDDSAVQAARRKAEQQKQNEQLQELVEQKEVEEKLVNERTREQTR